MGARFGVSSTDLFAPRLDLVSMRAWLRVSSTEFFASRLRLVALGAYLGIPSASVFFSLARLGGLWVHAVQYTVECTLLFTVTATSQMSCKVASVTT